MAKMIASFVSYEFTPDDIKLMIAENLEVSPEKVRVEYVQGDIGRGDPLDRYPAPTGIVKIRVLVDNRCEVIPT
jgi:hypothetical protein